jgi:high-affinity nickel-transport protein
MDAVVSAVLLGFVLGLQHATDPDHIVAVATIVTRERRFGAGARVGVWWGIGHAATLGIAGTLVVAFNAVIPGRVVAGLELLVAAMLITLGMLRLRGAVRGILTVAPEQRVGDHHHGRPPLGTLHAHHGAPHVHPPAALLAAWRGERRRVGLRALLVGAVHGMAGTAAIALLVLTTLHTAAAAAVYLVLFGLGTIAGMTALTAAMAFPLAAPFARLRRMRDAMAVASGAAAVAFGCWYAARLVI